MKKFTILTIIICSIFNISCVNAKADFKMVARIINLEEKIEVEVLESDVAYGNYLVIISNETDFKTIIGEKIEKQDLNVGDIVEIYYGGQVMMSYPPQIVAKKIVLK